MGSFCHRSRFRTNRGVLALFAFAFLPNAVQLPLSSLPGVILAQRTGRETCWAEFRLQEPENARLCIPRRLWVKRYSVRESWRGGWHAFSPLELEPGSSKQVYYSFHVSGRVNASTRQGLASLLISKIEKKRELLSEWLSRSGVDSSGIFRHLLLGEGDPALLPYRLLGMLHLMTASGIQLIALAAWIGFLLRTLLRFTGTGARPALVARDALTAAVWAWSWLLAGARAAMLRPLLLLGLRAAGNRTGIRWNRRALFVTTALLDFGIGAVFCLIHHQSLTNELMDRGRLFYLMAAGAALLAISADRSKGRISILKRFTFITFGTWAVSAIYLLSEDGFVALLNPWICWITLPLMAGVVYPVLIFRSLLPETLAHVCWDPASLLRFTARLLASLARLALAANSVWWVPREALILAILASAILWSLPKRLRIRAGTGMAVLLTLAGFFHREARELRLSSASAVEQLDVGQGDGALVLSGGGKLVPASDAGLIDAGSEHALSELQWLQLLTRNGVSRLDWMAATHLDEDHAGGVETLSEVAEVGCATTSTQELDSPRGRRWKEVLESRGVKVTDRLEDCIPFPALGPPPQARRYRGRSANENMSAFFIPLQPGGFYLSAGDATAESEPRIGAWASRLAEALPKGPRVLKISHHGSKTSSNPVFLRQIAPTEAWISDGVGNRYGHPSPIVLERVSELGIPIHRTDEEGTLIVGGMIASRKMTTGCSKGPRCEAAAFKSTEAYMKVR